MTVAPPPHDARVDDPDGTLAVLVDRWLAIGATRAEAEGLVEANLLTGVVFEVDYRVLRGYRAGVVATMAIRF